MSLEAAIVAKLKSASAVESVVGGRYYPIGRPAGPRPNIVYQIIGSRGGYSNDGPTRLYRSTMQVVCYADDPKAVKSLSAAVATALDGYAGIVAGVTFHSLFIDDIRDSPEPPISGQDRGPAGSILMLEIAHSE